MATKRRSIARRAIPGLVALLMGAPVAVVRASQPMTAEQAQVESMRYGHRAAHLRKIGSPAYKWGEVQRAEARQAKYAALAERLSSPPVWRRPSPIAEHYEEVAEHYRAMAGGPAYKWGRVAEAEAQARYFESIEQTEEPPEPLGAFGLEIIDPAPPALDERPSCETVSKPVVLALDCTQP